jgi:hypothetical protein
MLKEEAVWLRRQLERLDPKSIYPMCNLGSATSHYRTVEQPYVDAELFARARTLGHEVVHVDLVAGPGVDLVGDFSDGKLLPQLRRKNFKSVMCCNLLEHVIDRQDFSDKVISIIDPGGYIIASVPNVYPYHEYPIDTMFRPDIGELVALFPETEIISAEIVHANAFDSDMRGNWQRAFWLAVRICVPIYRPKKWAASVKYLLGLWHGYRVTCVILRRLSSTGAL